MPPARNGSADIVDEADSDESTSILFAPRYLPPRQYINPIRGLTPARAIALIDWAQYGFKADLMWTYAAVERKEPVLRALKDRRLSAIKKLKWTIRVRDSVKDKVKDDALLNDEVEAQKDALREVYEGIDNITEALSFMALATFRGYAHLEMHVDDSGLVTHLEPVPQWYWCFSYPIREWLFNPQALQTNAGTPIDDRAFVVREIDDPLDEIAIIIFLRKNLSKKDWDMFVETFGVPSLFAKCTDPAMRVSDAAATVQTIEKVIGNGRGVLPPGWDMMSTSSMIGAANHPFQPHLEYQNFELVLAGTGGKLTMLSDSTGIGQGASPAHEQVFEDIAQAEGEEICACLRRQIDMPELKRRGFEKPLVEFALEMMKPEDKEKNANILGAVAAAGYRTSDEQASEMLEMEVHSVMGGGGEQQPDVFGGDDGMGDEAPAEEGSLAEDEGGDQAANKRYFDAPGDVASAPFAEAAMAHPEGRKESADFVRRMTVPYADQSDMRSEANPDPPIALGKYPVARDQDRYIEAMRKAIRKYQRSFAKGVSSDLKPIRDKVRSILALDKPEELVNRLRELERELPTELGKMVRNSKAAQAMEAALTESIERGAKPIR